MFGMSIQARIAAFEQHFANYAKYDEYYVPEIWDNQEVTSDSILDNLKDIWEDDGDSRYAIPKDEIEADYFAAKRQLENLAKMHMRGDVEYYNSKRAASENNSSDDRVVISPYVTKKDTAKRDRTKYVQTLGDVIYEYEWNLMTYDTWNTCEQEYEDLDLSFDLNNFKGHRGIIITPDVNSTGITTELECELVNFNFYPKPYRYMNGMYYTENERLILSSYRAVIDMLEVSNIKRHVSDITDDPAVLYVAEEIKKGQLYLEFCERYDIKPEWRDVHRHYGVWFTENIVTYDLFEEVVTIEDDETRWNLFDALASGGYVAGKRIEFEQATSWMSEADLVQKAYNRHVNFYPYENYHVRSYDTPDEDGDLFSIVYGYNEHAVIVENNEFQEDLITEYIEDYDDYYDREEEIQAYYDTIEQQSQDEMVEIEARIHDEYIQNKPAIETEMRLVQYKIDEMQDLIEERGIDKISNPSERAARMVTARLDADMAIEEDIRPVVEKVMQMRHKPPRDMSRNIGWNTKYRDISDISSFEDMLEWRGSKFQNRAKDLLKDISDSMSDEFYNMMKGDYSCLEGEEDIGDKMFFGNSDFDSLLSGGGHTLDIDITESMQDYIDRNSDYEDRKKKVQYTEEEIDALGFGMGPYDNVSPESMKMYAPLRDDQIINNQIPDDAWE
ncbi:MAG: hypothetical protein ACRCXX_08625 [Cetobacterium sp.]|uniref:hypothetical protein n=1 Tax=Cetobacterium sp. TaxID=2071632 RepID=UPI003F3AD1AD